MKRLDSVNVRVWDRVIASVANRVWDRVRNRVYASVADRVRARVLDSMYLDQAIALRGEDA